MSVQGDLDLVHAIAGSLDRGLDRIVGPGAIAGTAGAVHSFGRWAEPSDSTGGEVAFWHCVVRTRSVVRAGVVCEKSMYD